MLWNCLAKKIKENGPVDKRYVDFHTKQTVGEKDPNELGMDQPFIKSV